MVVECHLQIVLVGFYLSLFECLHRHNLDMNGQVSGTSIHPLTSPVTSSRLASSLFVLWSCGRGVVFPHLSAMYFTRTDLWVGGACFGIPPALQCYSARGWQLLVFIWWFLCALGCLCHLAVGTKHWPFGILIVLDKKWMYYFFISQDNLLSLNQPMGHLCLRYPSLSAIWTKCMKWNIRSSSPFIP